MATSALVLTNGVPRMTAITASSPLIYDTNVTIVTSGQSLPTSINAPVTSGTAITLPSSGSYTLNANSIANLTIYFNSQRLEQTFDWSTSGAGPTYTAIQLTFGLVSGDRLDFRIERAS